jgi:predicted adenylyl cyclase CyaB
MAENIEIKARLADPARTCRLARALSDVSAQVLSQRDVFFCVPRGRLKLRWEDNRAYLVYYERVDDPGPRSSTYHVSESRDPASLEQLLACALGVRGEVRKQRTLYVAGRTRIHVDAVDGLGHFLELEAVLGPEQTAEQAYRVVRSLMQQLEITETDLVDVAYIDLLEQQGEL